jgi:transposase InsO family protein
MVYYSYGFATSLITSILSRCPTCQIHSTKSVKPPIYPTTTLSSDERWMMDYTQFESNYWLLVVIDCFSRRVWTGAYATKEEKNVIEKLTELFQNSRPSIIQSDNGGVSNLLIFYCL